MNMNKFVFDNIQILKNTPEVLRALLFGLDDEVLQRNEGENTWCSLEIVAHLVSNEQSNFYHRIMLILENDEVPVLAPFDMEVQKKIMIGKNMMDLLNQFEKLRNQNLDKILNEFSTVDTQNKVAIHPTLGKVTLNNIFSTWLAHDLSHIAQIARVLAKQYKKDVGGFIEYLNFLNS